MSGKETGSDILLSAMKNVIYNNRGRFILLKDLFSAAENEDADMPVWLQSPEGQTAFRNAVMRLVSENIVTPVGAKPGTKDGLHLKYRISKTAEAKNDELVSQIIREIKVPASLDHYLKNPEDFIADRDVIGAIMRFLGKKGEDTVTVNERAYELFGDEKFFRGDDKSRSRGEVVLKRLGLSYGDIGCEETLEPFFSFQASGFAAAAGRKIYVIENRDTFWSFKRSIMDSPSRIRADMTIYGEGRKIISSFRFVAEYGIDSQRDDFFYFGDLDPEGINIYCELKDKYPEYRIMPFCEGYAAVLETGLRNTLKKTRKQQKINRENISRFAGTFDPAVAQKIRELLENGFYIPQEALSAAEMKERFGSIR